jgi:serine/threonine protein kinase
MVRPTKPTADPVTHRVPGIDLVTAGETALVSVGGLVDEHFAGFGTIPGSIKSLVLNVAGMTRMTSFGVRQWLKAFEALPKSIANIYLLGCPTFFVDQLNMVLNFGGSSQVLTVLAPFTCPACGTEAAETIDVLADRGILVKGQVPDKVCTRCGGKLEFDETPESYFSFIAKYAATSIMAEPAQVLASHGLYSAIDVAAEKPPKILKLVRGAVTYFRIGGVIGSSFRARPFLVGAEGEVVIDLAEVERFDPLGLREWRRLLKSLATQVPALTLVDVTESLLTEAGDSFRIARNIAVASVLVPYRCVDCERPAPRSESLIGVTWPLELGEAVCPTCGGTTRAEVREHAYTPLVNAPTNVPTASTKLIAQRTEILSRALTDANVAKAGQAATPVIGAEGAILGKYQIVRPLSAGGMAEVFVAKQVGIGGFEKPVALKRIQRQLLETRHLAIDMFLNEAKIAGRLMHPNIVQVLDVGEVGGALYLAMEFVRGKDLRDILKKLRATRAIVPLGDALYVVREVAQALHYAYWSTDMEGNQLNVVHRDVSPHNVILSYDGAVKLLDFGVAMSSVTEQSEKMIVGKWQYMSPESTMNQTIDHRSDLFSLGVVLYLLCTGTMPFVGADPKEIVRKIRAGQYKPLEQVAPRLPDDLATLLRSMLSPQPADRPQTGREVVNTLGEIERKYGYSGSPASIAQFVSDAFPEERGEPDVIEIVRTTASGMGVASASSSRFGIGSAQESLDDNSRSPTAGRITPTSIDASTPNRITPSGILTPDASVSLARRSEPLAPPAGPVAQAASAGRSPIVPRPPVREAPSNKRVLLLLLLLALVAAAALFFVVRPL